VYQWGTGLDEREKERERDPSLVRTLAPLRTQWSPASLAVVLAAPASEPLPGSDSMKHPIDSPDAHGVRYLACRG
jgi:hypothetical protein